MSKLLYGVADTNLKIVEATQSDIAMLKAKHGIEYNSEDFAIVKGTYMHLDKANRNEHYVSKKEGEQALSTLIGKPVNIFHKRDQSRGFYFNAELEDGAMVTKALFWKEAYATDWITVENWISTNEAGQSFELVYKERANRAKEGEKGFDIELFGIRFVGGAILPKVKAADNETDLVLIAKEFKSKYPGILCAAFAQGDDDEDPADQDTANQYWESEEGKMKLATIKVERALSWDSIRDILYEAKCPTCKETYSTIRSINFVDKVAELECYQCEKKFKVSYKNPTKKATKNKEEEVMEEKIKELEAKIVELTALIETAKVEAETKVYTQVDVDAKVKEAIDAKELEAKEAAAAEKIKTDRIAEIEKIKPLNDEEKASLDISTEEKFELVKVKRENEVLKEAVAKAKVTVGGIEDGKESSDIDPSME